MFRLLALAVVCFLPPALVSAAPQAECSFDEHGLASLTYGGFQFLKNGRPPVPNVYFANDKGAAVIADKNNPAMAFDRATRTFSYAWPWGGVRYAYELKGNRLNIEMTVENATAGPMTEVEISLIELRFPQRPLGTQWEKRYQIIGDNDSDVTMLPADYQTGTLTFCNDDPRSIVRCVYSPLAQPPQETWQVLVTSPEPYLPELKVFVPARSERKFHFSLRFSEPGASLKSIAGDLIDKFVDAHPFQLKWPDRRPIGMWVAASSAHSSPSNPRGWFNEPGDNFVGKNGAKRFRQKVFEVANRAMGIMKAMGAQGMILWDMEGEQYPNINFVGDPRMTADLAPEMAEVAPELFAHFHKAGFRTGVCIRPSRIVPGWDGKSKYQHSNFGFDVIEEMNQKIIYAKKNLGCLLFYVDTNVRWYNNAKGEPTGHIMAGEDFKRLADMHPDILLIPEIPKLEYWSCTAPYQDLHVEFGNHAGTDQRVLQFYPRAFSVINPVGGPIQQRRADLVASQRRGDTMFFACWYPDGQNRVLRAILDEADRK